MTQNYPTTQGYSPVYGESIALDVIQPAPIDSRSIKTVPRVAYPTSSQHSIQPPARIAKHHGQPFRHQKHRSIVEDAPTIARTDRQFASESPEWLAEVAIKNADLADQLIRLNASRYKLASRLDQAKDQLVEIERDLQSVSAKINEYGMTPTIGLLLRHRQQQLDTWQTQDNETLFARSELGKAQRAELYLELLANPDESVEKRADSMLRGMGMIESGNEYRLRRPPLIRLLDERLQLVAQLKSDYRQYHHDLDVLDSTASASGTVTADYRKLIRKHVTWIRSGEPIGIADFGRTQHALSELFKFRHTRQFGRDLSEKLAVDQSGGLVLLGLLLGLLLIRWRLKSWLVSISVKKRMANSGKIRVVVAGGLTLALASILPLLGYATGWWLSRGIVTETLLQVASGLYAASLISLLIEVPRQILRPFGFADKHLAKSISSRKQAFKGLSVAGVFLVPGAFAVTLFRLLDHGIWHDSLGRLTFMSLMAGLALWGHFALRPRKGFLCQVVRAFGGRLATGFGHLWYVLAVGFPLIMGGLSALGYDYTSSELIRRATMSIILILVAGVLWTIVRTGFSLAWRKLTQSGVEPQYDEYGLIEADTSMDDVDETHVLLQHQLGFLGQCLGGIALIGCFAWLWADVVPNTNLASHVMWSVQDTIVSDAMDPSGTMVGPTTQMTSITLLHLVMAGAILFFTIQMARLLPNLFDILILQRVDYDEGMEHLVLVVGRWLVFAIGCFLSCRLIGVRWATIQWLMVGATVGLGFGLQDMVRNLLGGFVVLFARPVSVGDRVTVGRVTGRVASQTLRMTILSDDEGRQLQIPNKRFLSEEVTSWRGAGKLTTVSIEVATSREQRPIDLGRMMMGWAADEKSVLHSPPPQVTLICVGKQTQRFELHVWIEVEDQARQVRDSLLKTVRRNLRDQNLLAKTQPDQPPIQRGKQELKTDAVVSRRRTA